MNLLMGHEKLQRREIFGFTADGHALVDYGDDGLKPYKLYVTAAGRIEAEPIPDSDRNDVDQIGGSISRRTLADRLRGVDQA